MSDINADAAPAAWPVANAVAEGTPAPEAVAQVALQQELAEAGSAEEGKPIESGSTVESTPSADTSIPSGSEISSAGDAGNVASSDSTSSKPAESAEASTGTDLPRESHLMLLEHKLAAMHAKFMTGERILIDEFEQILGHIRAVL